MDCKLASPFSLSAHSLRYLLRSIIDTGWQVEMELSTSDLTKMQSEYRATIDAVHKKVVAKGGYIWQMVQPSGPFPARMVQGHNWLSKNNQSKATCKNWLRAACVKSAPLSKLPLLHAFSIKGKGQFKELPSVMEDLASFLLTRGDYGWMGHAWGGCTMDFAYPPVLNEDFGEPQTIDCHEIGSSAIFVRNWTKATVSVDCNTLSGNIEMADGRVLSSTEGVDSSESDRRDVASRLAQTRSGGYGGRGFAIPQQHNRVGEPLTKPISGSPNPPPVMWRLPPIDWSAGGVVGPTDEFAVRAFDVVYWQPENKWYLYCDLVLYSNPKCPASFGSEIGVFSADTIDSPWTYHGIAVRKNHSHADEGGLATPTAIVRDGKIFVYFAYEGLPVGAGLRGIGGATATHPLGPFIRTPPVAVAPAGWHRPAGPGGILDDPEVIFWGGRFHLFHSRKHLQPGDFNCSRTPDTPTQSSFWSHCVEWRTSIDGITWERKGVLDAEGMSETMSARVYPNDELVLMTDGAGMVAFTANASGLMADDASKLGPWTPGLPVNKYAGLNGSFVNVALRVLPIDAERPTHVALGWRPSQTLDSRSVDTCRGAMTFAVFPLHG